jgi:unsaturated rhamnogalacturonyl hydrolase
MLASGVLVAGLGAFYMQSSLRGAVPRQTIAAGADLQKLIEPSMVGVARTWIADHPAQDLPFLWGEGVLMLGLDCAAQHVRDQSAALAIDRYVRAYYEAHAERATTFTWSDQLTPAIAAATRLARGETARRRVVDDAVRYALNAPRTPSHHVITHFGRSPLRYLAPPFPEAWVDSLFHVVPLLVRHAHIANASRELDEAAEQVVRFMRVVQDPSTGLVTHAFSEHDGSVVLQPPLSAQAFWLRGQGWVLASGVEAWSALHESHALRAELAGRSRRLAQALIARQAASGLFHTLVTRSNTYEETAGSALVIYALARGAKVELLGDEARAAAARGMRGLLAIVDHDGARHVITGTSLGTNPWPAIYAYVPTASQVSYGVGAWLLAACEHAEP